MAGLQSGGGTSAVSASAHAGCERFRMTDPFLTRKTRKTLATHLGAPDAGTGIPEARWMRAMTFESLVHSERFVSELLTKTIGQLGLPRPDKVARATCNSSVDATAKALNDAHLKAHFADTATMVNALGVPYLSLEHESATAVLPDFAIVAPRREGDRVAGSWLIMGDAKDYERVRARIDDARMLKGFLQVALGAESAAAWTLLPTGMVVHRYGALAVPRNAFLQPEAVVEQLDDHRTEVRIRARERLAAKEELGEDRPSAEELADYVAHRTATFDPTSCVSCNLFSYCRGELRSSSKPLDLLTEIGIAPAMRPMLTGLLDGSGDIGVVPPSILLQVTATLDGLPVWSERRRTDPCGQPGAIDVVLAKADAAALGIHGVAARRAGGEWDRRTFLEPQAPTTRRGVMGVIGKAIAEARDAQALPLHVIVPDRVTADVLVSAADSVAGVELSRMRWQRDLDMGREALTFDGTPATLADPLNEYERLGVAFLLEDDRSRALKTRTPIIELRRTLASHLTAGGPAVDAGRLDYLVAWGYATSPVDHRALSDEVAALPHTPGARATNTESDAIHDAYKRRQDDPAIYRGLVNQALDYKTDVFEGALELLERRTVSILRDIYAALESDSQEVWWRRVTLEALDLVRFGRTTEFWRNTQVKLLENDETCAKQLAFLADHSLASEAAVDAGTVQLTSGHVIALDPIRLALGSRRFGDGDVAVGLHLNGEPLVERDTTTLKIQAGSFKFGDMPIATLAADEEYGLLWSPKVPLDLAIGDELVLANGSWFNSVLKNQREFTVIRPGVDQLSAPKVDCNANTFEADPVGHRWCCRPHKVAEADTSDYFAERRAAGQMNPEKWPPLVDEERFDVGPDLAPTLTSGAAPDHLTADDVD